MSDITSPENILARLLEELKSGDAAHFLSAIRELNQLTFSSPAILNELEKHSVNDPSDEVRAAALQALDSATHRYIRGRINKLSRVERSSILNEINEWEKAGLLESEQAKAIRKRYDFDIAPLPSAPKPVPVQPTQPPPQPVPPQPAPVAAVSVEPTAPQPVSSSPVARDSELVSPTPVSTLRHAQGDAATSPASTSLSAKPRPSLLQTLLSETSVKIFLYLGAFFVISAAIILGTLVAAARLPILLVATVIFGIGSIAIKKRLPQPSFTLFIVFSFLLPIDANVFDDPLALTGNALNAYWATVLFFMALTWAFAVWFYESRFFSLASFIAFEWGLAYLLQIFTTESEPFLIVFSVSLLVGLAGAWSMKLWKDAKFALPLFLLVQIASFIIALWLFAANILRLTGSFFGDGIAQSVFWILAALSWILIAVFYFFSDRLYPFPLFPWAFALALLPVPWVFLSAFEASYLPMSIGFSIWGIAYAAISEWTRVTTDERAQKYHFPFLYFTFPSFLAAWGWGIAEKTEYGLAASLLIALVYTALSVRKTRVVFWSAALVSIQAAYFTFFNLSFIKSMDIYLGYILLGAGLLTLLPDLLLKKDFTHAPAWRWPLRVIGGILFAYMLLFLLYEKDQLGNRIALVLGIYAIFFLIYAIAFNAAWISALFTVLAPVSALFLLDYLQSDLWLPVLTAFALGYYAVGFFLRGETKRGWGYVFRYSGLALGMALSLAALFGEKETGGWYVLVIGALFVAEMYIEKQSMFELGAHVLFPIAYYIILRDFREDWQSYLFTGFGVIWLGLDLLFAKTFKEKRPLILPVRALGGFATLIATLFALTEDNLLRASTCFGVLAVFFTVYAFFHRKAWMGYLVALYLALCAHHSLYDMGLNVWLPSMIGLTVAYFLAGFFVSRRETQSGLAVSWSEMMRASGLALGSIVSLSAFVIEPWFGGHYVAIVAGLFIAEMFLRENGWLEIGAQVFGGMAAFMVVWGSSIDHPAYQLLAVNLTWLALDLILFKTFKPARRIAIPVWIAIGVLAVFNTGQIVDLSPIGSIIPVICIGIYSAFFALFALVRQKPALSYIPAAYIALTVLFTLEYYDVDAWLPALTGLAALYFVAGFALKPKKEWSEALRNSALALGSLVSLGALFTLKETGGWYAALIAALFIVEMFARKQGLFEAGAQVLLPIAFFMILHDFDIIEYAYIALGIGLIWLGLDVILHKTYREARLLAWPVRGFGGIVALSNAMYLLFKGIDEPRVALICFGVYALFFLAHAALYRQPLLGYNVTLSLGFTLLYALRSFGWNEWFLPITALSAIYYGAGYFMRTRWSDDAEQSETRVETNVTWSFVLWTSGMGVGLITSFLAPLKGGLSAAIPSAVTATMVAMEAFTRRNVWLGFPANALYLMSYFVLLFELKVDEPQFFSVGAAALGLLMHYLLTRVESKTAAFITGMVSQLVLLSVSYIQMVNTEQLGFFAILFFQSLIVTIYGLVIRSRSLVFTPIFFVVIGVVTVIYSALKGISTVVLIGCAGIILLLAGILAVILRERITKMGERLSDWNA